MSDDLRAQLKAQGASPALLKLHEHGPVPSCSLSDDERRQLRTAAAPEPERAVPAAFGVNGFAHPDVRVRVARGAWLTTSGRLEPKRSSSRGRAPRRRGRRSRRTVVAAASSSRGSPDRPPRLCGCGCGEPVPAARRKYASDACENRAAQRRWYERQRVERSAQKHAEQAAYRDWWLEQLPLAELLEIGRAIWPELAPRAEAVTA
jgi:hypothetical protein